jgi:uncharacterized protein YceH (UPF0502 family)
VAILTMLMLRGPQTAAELRVATERLHRFADTSSVEGFLEELSERPMEQCGPLVVKLARAPGSRESRWAHLLGGPVLQASVPPDAPAEDPIGAGEMAALKSNQQRLQAELAELRTLVERLYSELGVQRH